MFTWGYKHFRGDARRYARGDCFLASGIFLLSLPAIAKPPGDGKLVVEQESVSAEIEGLDSFQAEQERLKRLLADKPKAYQDKFMDTNQAPAVDFIREENPEPEPEGLRTFSLESRVDVADSTATNTEGSKLSTGGIRTEYRLETANHGEIVFQLDARGRNTTDTPGSFTVLETEGKQKNAKATVRNLGLPVTTEIQANTSAGVINSEITNSLGRNYRLALGTSPVQGVGTRVYSKGFDLRAGYGQLGELRGSPYPGFEATGGKLSWLGYSHKIGDNMQAGIQLNQAQDVPVLNLDDDAFSGETENITSLAASLGYGQEQLDHDGLKVRATAIGSKVSGKSAEHGQNANGVFLEAGFRKGRYRNELGTYAAEPGLHFGDGLLLANNRGAYWRIDREGSRFNAGGGVDIEQTNPSESSGEIASKRIGMNANALYQFNADRQLGGNIHVSHTDTSTNPASDEKTSKSRSTTASLNYQTRFSNMGHSRFNAILRRNESLVSNGVTATGDEIQWEQEWVTGKYETMRPELTTTLGVAHDRSAGNTQTYPTAAINARYWLDADWNISGNLRYTSRDGNLSTSQGLAGTVATEYKLGKEWQLGASASVNEAQVNYQGSSLMEPELFRTQDKHMYAYLRWQKTSGKPYSVLGNKTPGVAGSGDISGVVFFDENRDGVQQASEAGAPSVEVLLDGHYQMATGAKGEFRFAQVATGSHQLGLNLDSIPLPWGVSDTAGQEVSVPLRGQARSNIPLIKIN